MITTHHPIAHHRSAPGSRPARKPRRVSITGVNGWFSANHATPVGIESVGTKALETKGSSTRNIGLLLAVSTLPAARPRATHSQVSASASSARTASAPSQSAAPASGR